MSEPKYYMGINLGHERSVALVKEGEIIVAIEQERLDRYKYSLGFTLQAPGVASQIQLPHESIRYCLNHCGITLTDIAAIVPNMPGRDLAPEIVKRVFPEEIARRVVAIGSHHLAHAYSAFWPSGFQEAIVLVADATGNTNAEYQTESYTLYEGQGTVLTTLHSEMVASHFTALSTLGFIYEYITRKAGFVTKVDSEGKIIHAEAGKLMGLAPYGSEQPNLHRWIKTVENSYHLSISAYDIFLEVAALEKRYDTGMGKPYLRPYLVDLAYKVQHELEDALLHLVSLAMKQTGLRKLCLAGGIGLNSVANYNLLKKLNLEDIFIFPAAGDAGIAAGCALWAYHAIGGGQQRTKLKRANLGHRYSQDQITQALRQFESTLEVEELAPSEMLERSTQMLARGHIVARFEGRCEYGPRALGQRSIMVDPTFEKMKDVLNARVKFREAFRPFAPVVPLEQVNQVCELEVGTPFMLLVPPIRAEYQKQLPAITHVDGTGRVQTVTAEDNPYFYHLCCKLAEVRKGPPVLLNTSFNLAGQPIVETPEEAIQTFLQTDIDYLALEQFWISKRHLHVQTYQQHVENLKDTPMPKGLASHMPAVTELMRKLDRALFWGEINESPWSEEELRTLSAQGAFYKETSVLFPEKPFHFRSQLSEHVRLWIDPLGKSTIADLKECAPPSNYSFEEIKLLIMMLEAPDNWQEQCRLTLQLTHAEFDQRLHWALSQLNIYRLQAKQKYFGFLPPDSNLPVVSTQTLAPFADKNFSICRALSHLRACLLHYDYTDTHICSLLKISSQQQIEPTYLYYYNHYQLPHTATGDLIRLFLLRVSLSEGRLRELFGDELFSVLVSLGILICQGKHWLSKIDLFCAHGLYLATDHRYFLQMEDNLGDEEPVMYVGVDSMGLVYTAPRFPANRILDLCCGCGIQGLIASRYAKEVVAVDLNPRAIRFTRFNAQLNGIRNIHCLLGHLYEPLQNQTFDTILANPPFVPSPKREIRFRDGGKNGEEILEQIIRQSADYLNSDGKLFIVSDLVDVHAYETKLNQWWLGGPAHKLVLCTADRDDILFSIPHSHAPFGQSCQQYNAILEQWLQNFRTAHLTSVNFGYLLIYRLPVHRIGSYYVRTIHNPNHPIHQEVKNYFQQRELLEHADQDNFFIRLYEDIHFRIEKDKEGNYYKIELFSPNNPYFTVYQTNEQVYRLLQDINRLQPEWNLFVTAKNFRLILDLVNKGIIYLSLKRSVLIKRFQQEETTIIELHTRTTPTCLSSYLNI